MPPTHEALVQSIRSWIAHPQDGTPPHSLVDPWLSAIREAEQQLGTLREQGAPLDAELDEASAAAIAALQAYAAVLDEVRECDPGGAERILPRLEARHADVRAAHDRLLDVSRREAVGLDLDPAIAGFPNLLKLQATLRSYRCGHVDHTEAAAAVAWLQDCFATAIDQLPGESAPDGSEASAALYEAGERLADAYRLGLAALGVLDGQLPSGRADALTPAWDDLQEAFRQIAEAQTTIGDVDEQTALDVGEDGF